MATRRRHQGSDLGARVLAAIPAIIFAAIIVGYGGLVWALGVSALGIVCLAELYKLMGRVHPANIAGFISVIALALAALYGGHFQLVLVLVASVPLTFFFTLARPRRAHASWATAVVLFGTIWIGMAMAHAVLLRDLDHGGSLVVADAARHVSRRHRRLLRRPLVRPHPARPEPVAEQDARGACMRRRRRHARVLAVPGRLPRLDQRG